MNYNGQIHVYTGSGKGKTTASLGLAIRAIGKGLKVAIIYFDKGGGFYNEIKIIKKLKEIYPERIKYKSYGISRMSKDRNFRFENNKEDLKQAEKALSLANNWIKEDLNLLILDEINTTVKTKLLKLDKILDLVNNKPKELELVLTGRYCPKEIIEKADLVTNMQDVKHYINNNIPARSGIDY